MKKIEFTILTFILLANGFAYGQKDLSVFGKIEAVHVTSFWGEMDLIGTEPGEDDRFSLSAFYTNSYNRKSRIEDYSEYLDFRVQDRKLYIKARKPEGFESIDLSIRIPKDLFLEAKLIKGGNIHADNFENGVEINILNGSVKMENMSKYAFVNAANGEIVAKFKQVDRDKAISLVTMNGGVTVSLPEDARRDVRLISRKNGYVESDLELTADEKIINLNKREYSKEPIINTAKINGGGELLFLSTENGPISIKKKKG